MSEIAQEAQAAVEDLKAVEKAVVERVAPAVAAVEEAQAKAVDRVRVALEAEEKFAVRDLENMFLKKQMQATQIGQELQNLSRQFTDLVNGFTKKYAIDPNVYVFDAMELAFKKKP